MILNVYVICKIIIHDILLENKFSKVQMQTVNGKRNLQIIASILYYTIKEKFVGMTKVNKDEKPREVKKKTEINFFKKKKKKETNKEEEGKEETIKTKANDFDKYDPKYDQAYKKFLSKKENQSKNEIDLKKKIEEKLTVYEPDTLSDGIEFIESKLLNKDETDEYFKILNDSGFNLKKMLVDWDNKIYDIIQKLYNKDIIDENGNDMNVDNNNDNDNDSAND